MSDIITKLQRVVWAEKQCRGNGVVLVTFGAHIGGLLIDGLVVGKVICYIASSFSPRDSVLERFTLKICKQTNIKHV